ncbi:hypothetical protein [Sphingobacterium sp.]|uniref:hypothetical protein n=1 Tax=Sphingobacterium sp. TaxID=341027 RepID=UPI0028B1D69A|nr:hypothetical protein [Sphingobacterium sp.]
MDQNRGLNQDEWDARMDQDEWDARMDHDLGVEPGCPSTQLRVQDARMDQDCVHHVVGKVADFVGAYCISPLPAILISISPFRWINSFILLGQIINPQRG